MKKNMLKKLSRIFVVVLPLFSIASPALTVVQAEQRIETRGRHDINRDGGGPQSYINLASYTNKIW
ncbi:hypothetical protein [Streptococcus cuniculi]|uniref:hypothetical protein n=1 Tax=Streptococcus cuniculi TaxID=1432788 RepID=UPI001FC95640|nr:hypothetical protein [Streptococcus cuniculi]